DHERGRDEHVDDGDEIRLLAVGANSFDRDGVLVADPAPARLRDRAKDAAAVEKADREQVEGVEEEADVREDHEPRRALRGTDHPRRGRPESADAGTGERDERAAPRRQPRPLYGDESAEERDERRQRDGYSLTPGLDDMAEFVHEDQ